MTLSEESKAEPGFVKNWLGFFAGLAGFAVLLLLPAPDGLPPEAQKVAALTLLMAIWWITEAIPIPATALLPLILLPILGVSVTKEAAAPYADPIIFLFLGGFIIGAATQRWDLHKRIGLTAISTIGTRPSRLIGGFMLGTAILSMWVSNTATAVMMLPVAVSVTALLNERAGPRDSVSAEERNFGTGLMLAVAYGASIGGLGTLVGTPPNALLAGYMSREHGVEIGFAQWMVVGIPVVIIMLLAAWLVLVRIYPISDDIGDGARQIVEDEKGKLGAMTTAEKRVGAIFLLTALAWVTRPLFSDYIPGIDDTVIAIAGALLLFMIPSGMSEDESDNRRLLDWDDLKRLPWGVLLLFGGGLSLAGSISGSGLAEWIGTLLEGFAAWPIILIVALATVAMIFLTEITSNTASAATFLPLGGAVAVGMGLDPMLLAVPLALAASCAFMLPVATPPNAIVYASGQVSIKQMMTAGIWLNIIGSAVIVGATFATAGWLFGG
ncbi:MAG: DASS family sodium-coupled anion symporter [Alphaproteobacteria bacterium]|nr:DASS family sodium-coupled anion symporter [Alphaproteobacteria bacterium]MBU0799198.1 DASS family sodium-coupled anion symporter [Alphaproteobacteria bacterium]MBU0887551.1 DASS family sodium-coupled anion symporter [Alphaproteobacteria bacterium]MBU1814788.1 DASS family sodium-coupled anion symporter [Alphaproteobacteria bacterium]MBU2090804.1 DASS family sodium-coupled anion symporter [Alphaproteobacteria bacterium]